jgi:predicted oxidoreductase
VDSREAAVGELVVVANEKREFLKGRFTRAVHLDHVMEEAKDGSIEVQLEVLGRSRLQTVE